MDEDRVSNDIATSVTDTLYEKMEEQQKKELADNPFSGFGTAMMEMMKPRISEMAKDQVRTAIDEALGKNVSLDQKQPAAPALSAQSYKGIKLEKTITVGNTAEAIFTNLPPDLPGNIRELHVRLARIPDSRRWRVVGVPDFGTMFSAIMGEAIPKSS